MPTTPGRRNKRCPRMNGTATREWIIVYDTSLRSYVKDKLSQKTFWPPIWRPLKILPPKVEKPTYGTELYTITQIFTPISTRYLSPGKKKYIFSCLYWPASIWPSMWGKKLKVTRRFNILFTHTDGEKTLQTKMNSAQLQFIGVMSSNGCRPPVTAGVSWW